MGPYYHDWTVCLNSLFVFPLSVIFTKYRLQKTTHRLPLSSDKVNSLSVSVIEIRTFVGSHAMLLSAVSVSLAFILSLDTATFH